MFEIKDISKGLDKCQFLPLNNIICSKANLRKCIEYQLSHSNNLLKLLCYDSSNPLSEPDIVDKNGDIIDYDFFRDNIKGKCLSYTDKLNTDNPKTESGSILTVGIYGRSNYHNEFSNINIHFSILVSEDILELYDSSNRIDLIQLELFKLFDKSESPFFIGKMNFSSFADITIPVSYRGEGLTFVVTEMNRNWEKYRNV